MSAPRRSSRVLDVFGSQELKTMLVSYVTPRDVLSFDLVARACAIENTYWASLIEEIISPSCGKMRLLRRRPPDLLCRKGEEEESIYEGLPDDKFLYWALNGAVNNVETVNLVPEYFVADSCSSVDRPTEGASNVNYQSQCFRELADTGSLGKEVPDTIDIETITPMAGSQLRCGCAVSDACYWCSKASPDGDGVEWIDFKQVGRHGHGDRVRRRLQSLMQNIVEKDCEFDIALFKSLKITVYRSYFQPNGPIFAPRRVQLQLWHGLNRDDDEEDAAEDPGPKLLYKSPEFEVLATEEEQTFTFPRPLVLPLSPKDLAMCEYSLRLKVLGAHQRQTIGEQVDVEHADWFYVCISQAAVEGNTLQWANPRCSGLNSFLKLASADCSQEGNMLTLNMGPHEPFAATVPQAQSSPPRGTHTRVSEINREEVSDKFYY